jgi:hypothetical protein
MWTSLATPSVCLDCRPPFSFYFDIVSVHWKAATNPLPLHRICTLTRKQRASFVAVDCALSRSHVIDELNALDEMCGGGGEAQAVALSFFSGEISAANISDVAPNSLLADVVLINYKPKGAANFSHSYIFEAILSPLKNSPATGESRLLLNNFVAADAEFERTVSGRKFKLRGVFYCQQNDTVHVCAHACLRMAINSAGQFARPITNVEINKILGIKQQVSGLTSGQMEDVINSVSGLRAKVETNLKPEYFLPELGAIVESGYLALLGFTTNHHVAHIVTVFGHTRNSDEWHPQAIPAYSGPSSAKYLASSAWIDHFLIHDDNFGPHFSLSARSFDLDSTVKPCSIIGLLPAEPVVTSNYAEGLASSTLRNLLPMMQGLNASRWLDYVTKVPHEFVLRAILMKRSQYISHLREMVSHDLTVVDPDSIPELQALPEFFWMVEFSLPPLYTGNRSKLGEVIVSAANDATYNAGLVIGLRIPGVVLLQSAPGQLQAHPCKLETHSSIYECRAFDNHW